MYKSGESIIRGLQDQDFRFSFSMRSTEGAYSPMDAEWNYKDVPHLKVIHNLVEGVPGAIEDNFWSGFFVQRVGPFRFPITVFNSSTDRNSNTYFGAIGPFALIIQTSWTVKNDKTTLVKTQYSLGSLRYVRWTHRFIHRILSRNYDALMRADVPMRLRRGELRSMGYSFRSDAKGLSFQQSLDIYSEDVVLPENCSKFYWSEKLAAINEGETLIGENCLSGARIIRSDDSLLFFPRLCLHAGASLDTAERKDGNLICPWHGGVIRPFAEIKNGRVINSQNSKNLKVILSEDRVVIES